MWQLKASPEAPIKRVNNSRNFVKDLLIKVSDSRAHDYANHSTRGSCD